MLADPSSARQRLMGTTRPFEPAARAAELLPHAPHAALTRAFAPAALEERVPWKAVKKAWETRRAEWVAVVSETLDVPTLVQHLLILESMLKTDALSSQWNTHKNQWKARLSVCNSPGELESAANEFEAAIQWSRYLVGPDGRPLTEAEIASGMAFMHSKRVVHRDLVRACVPISSPGALSL